MGKIPLLDTLFFAHCNSYTLQHMLDRPAGWTSWTDQLDGAAGWSSWMEQLEVPAGQNSWTDQLDRPDLLFEALASSHIRRLTF